MSNDTYNGWTNRETWLANLWLDGYDVKRTDDSKSDVYFMIDNELDNLNNGLCIALLHSALSKVNWQEIDSHYDEYIAYNPKDGEL